MFLTATNLKANASFTCGYLTLFCQAIAFSSSDSHPHSFGDGFSCVCYLHLHMYPSFMYVMRVVRFGGLSNFLLLCLPLSTFCRTKEDYIMDITRKNG